MGPPGKSLCWFFLNSAVLFVISKALFFCVLVCLFVFWMFLKKKQLPVFFFFIDAMASLTSQLSRVIFLKQLLSSLKIVLDSYQRCGRDVQVKTWTEDTLLLFFIFYCCYYLLLLLLLFSPRNILWSSSSTQSNAVRQALGY